MSSVVLKHALCQHFGSACKSHSAGSLPWTATPCPPSLLGQMLAIHSEDQLQDFARGPIMSFEVPAMNHNGRNHLGAYRIGASRGPSSPCMQVPDTCCQTSLHMRQAANLQQPRVASRPGSSSCVFTLQKCSLMQVRIDLQ